MRIKKIVFAFFGCLSFALGTAGTVLPVLPTVPFYIMAAFCFAKSSEKLHSRFVNSQLYKKNLESYAQGKGMSKSAKRRIVLTVTAVMAVSLVLMKNTAAGMISLAAVWAAHVIYLVFFVKTFEGGEN